MYRTAIVTFLDILGFRELVSDSPVESVSRVLDQVGYFITPRNIGLEDLPEDFWPIVINFSDSVVRVWHVDSDLNKNHPFGILFQEVLSLLHAQGNLLQYGVLLRGGIAYGDVNASSSRVFGPALIEAFDLESKFALYPRIVVSPNLLRAMESDPLLRGKDHHLDDEKEHLNRMLRQGDDGIWFIDYMRAILTELDEPEMYIEFLEGHKRIIEKSQNQSMVLSSKTTKYVWLAKYHNGVIDEIEDEWFGRYGIERKDLRIDNSCISALYIM